MRHFLKYIQTCLIVVFISQTVFAQATIRGKIVDASDGESLIGVTVYIVGTSLGTVTDLEGNYVKRNVPTGPFQLQFSYVGYETQVMDIDLEDGEILELDIELAAMSITGEVIEISAQALGQVAAINQQRTSNSVMNVVSEEKIKELPDANAAESIGRLSGVSLIRSGGEASKVVLRGLSDKYLNVTVDGVRIPSTDALGRGLDLSSVSQSSLSGIELYKTLTPDKDADAIAGTINLVTKKAPENREFLVSAKGGYNAIRSSANQYDASFKYGERFFDNFLGVQIFGNLEKKIRDNEFVNFGLQEEDESDADYEISGLNLEYVNENRTRNGIGVILDFNTPDDGNIKLSSSYTGTNRKYLLHTRDYPRTTGSVLYSYRDREQEINLFNTSLNGENRILGLNASWSVSYSQSKATYPYDYELEFIEASFGGVSGMKPFPSGEDFKDNPEEIANYAYNNFKAATLSQAFYRTQENTDSEFTTYLNLEKEYVLSNKVSGSLKVGGKYRSKNKSNEQTRRFAPYYLGYWRAFAFDADSNVVDKNFEGSYFEDFYNSFLEDPSITLPSFQSFLDENPDSKVILDEFNMNPLIVRDRLQQWYLINQNGVNQAGSNAEYHDDITAGANNYDITESVSSAYIMNTLDIGPFITTIIGTRIEQENHSYRNPFSPRQIGGFPVPVGATQDTSSTYNETNILPHAHVNIRPTDFLSLRLSAYKALARPDFNQRLTSYFPWREASTGGATILLLGNPKLETAKAWNYEVNASVYANKLGLFSVSVFTKHIEDMYFNINGITTSGDTLITYLDLDWTSPYRGNYELTVPYNSPGTSKIWGFEIDHQANLYWLPGALSGIVLSYNASWVRSEVTLIGGARDTTYVPDPIIGERPVYSVKVVERNSKISDQPDFFGNVSLGYDIGKFSGRLSLFHQAEFYRVFDPQGEANRIVGKFTRLDFSFNYKATDYLIITGSVNNLTNIYETDLQENQTANYVVTRNRERYGVTFDLGFRIDL